MLQQRDFRERAAVALAGGSPAEASAATAVPVSRPRRPIHWFGAVFRDYRGAAITACP